MAEKKIRSSKNHSEGAVFLRSGVLSSLAGVWTVMVVEYSFRFVENQIAFPVDAAK